MSELELALVELGRQLDYPPAPDLAPRVRARLAEGRAARVRFPRRRTVALAFAVLAVAIGAVMAVPQTRAAILELFGLKGVTIQRVEKLPEVPRQSRFGFGERVTLAEAQDRVGFELVIPEELGEPDVVFHRSSPPGGMVSFVYGSTDNPRALFTQFEATVDDVFFKKVAADTQIEEVRVSGRQGFWLSGEPHVFAYVDKTGNFREEDVRLAGSVLLWERGALTLRLEADVTKAEALEIARSTG